MVQTQAEIDEILQSVRTDRGWYIALGVALVILGTAAIVFPHVATLSTNLFVGWLLVIAGIVQFAHAFRVKDWSGFGFDLAIALLHAIAGIVLLIYPVAGVLALTIYLAVVFIAEGIIRSIRAIQHRSETGWVWLLIGGLASIAVGILLWTKLPSSATWAIGLLVGLNIAIAGWVLLMMAFSAGPSANNEANA